MEKSRSPLEVDCNEAAAVAFNTTAQLPSEKVPVVLQKKRFSQMLLLLFKWHVVFHLEFRYLVCFYVEEIPILRTSLST